MSHHSCRSSCACQGRDAAPGGARADALTSDAGAADSATPDAAASDASTPLPPPPPAAPLRRLTRIEYARTLHDLLGEDVDAVVAQLPPDLVASRFDNQAVAQAVPSLLAELQAFDRLAKANPPRRLD